MKTIKILIFVAIVSLPVISCNNDDDNSTNNNSDIAGEYNLTYLYIPEATDYNQDGISSQDLLMESSCYLDSQIVLNEDMSYTETNSYVFFISETGCQSEERFGTWEINGDIITLTDNTMELPSTKDYSYDNNELFRTEVNAQYPTRDGEGNPVYANGDLQYTYTKVN